MRTLFPIAFLLLPAAALADPAAEFWERLQALCGSAFSGSLIEAPPGESSLREGDLVMHVRDCSSDRVRIPFAVGEDRSRTWVLHRMGQRIELKHDHRHRDGSADAVTGYGGTTTNPGRPGQQFFPADEATQEMIEPAFANVWSVSIEPGERFTYALWRLGTEREYRIDFDLGEAVPLPPAPWGWEEWQ